MALKGSFTICGFTNPNAYIRLLEDPAGGPRAGAWRAAFGVCDYKLWKAYRGALRAASQPPDIAKATKEEAAQLRSAQAAFAAAHSARMEAEAAVLRIGKALKASKAAEKQKVEEQQDLEKQHLAAVEVENDAVTDENRLRESVTAAQEALRLAIQRKTVLLTEEALAAVQRAEAEAAPIQQLVVTAKYEEGIGAAAALFAQLKADARCAGMTDA